jgi:hypothetical protein
VKNQSALRIAEGAFRCAPTPPVRNFHRRDPYDLSYSTEGTMAIWNTLKGELDKAGKAAQGAIDEGKLRLESHRAKQRAEAAAASLGFAVYRARAAGGELETERYSVLAANLAGAEAEVARIDRELADRTAPGSASPSA